MYLCIIYYITYTCGHMLNMFTFAAVREFEVQKFCDPARRVRTQVQRGDALRRKGVGRRSRARNLLPPLHPNPDEPGHRVRQPQGQVRRLHVEHLSQVERDQHRDSGEARCPG